MNPVDPTRRRLLAGTAGTACAPLLANLDAVAQQASPDARPEVEVGRLERLPLVASRHVAPRHVDVWLPDGPRPAGGYAVLYMHDGQMLFDARTTWNRQAWNAHRAVHTLMARGLLPPTIVVGIWNNGVERYAEYFPEKALALAPEAARRDYLGREAQGRAKADAYLRFIVEELRPLLAQRLGTRSDRAHTWLAGASMGGLISLYALCEYPEVFGGAAGLSTHWVSVAPSRSEEDKRNEILSRAFLAYLGERLPRAGAHRLWVDRGDDALDALYAPGLEQFAGLLRERGYTDRDGTTRTFSGTGHNERDWSARLDQALAFIARAS